MHFADLELEAPRLAQVARSRLVDPGVPLVVTTRGDGTPRLSPVEPLLLDGDLWLSMMWKSRKAADLARDRRVLVHSIVTRRDGAQGELKLRGRAQPVDDLALRGRYAESVRPLGWSPVEPFFHLFVIDIVDVTFIRYEESGDQYVTRWPAGIEFVRRATSPTSVGKPEPCVDLLRVEPTPP